MKRLIAFFLSVLILCTGCTIALAAGEPTENVIKVGFPIQKGLTEIDDAGDFTGYTCEYLEHLSQFTNWEYEYVTVDGDLNTQILTLMDMLSNGEIDLLGCTIKNEQMTELYEYPEYSYGVAYTVLCALDTDTSISGATFPRRATDGLRVAAYETSQSRIALLEDFCDFNGYPCTVNTYPTTVSLTDVLDAGEADVSLGVDLNRDERTKIVASFGGVPYYFIATKGNTALVEEYDRAVRQLEETEPYLQDDLYNQFFSNNSNTFVLTDSEQLYVNTLDPIKVIIYNQHLPFQQKDENGNFSGISISLLEAISEKTGLRFEYLTQKEWESIAEDFTGNVLYVGVPRDSDSMHDPKVLLSHAYAETEMALYSNENLSIAELSDKVLALTEKDVPLKGYGYSEIQYYPSLQECIDAVADRKADYGLANSYSVSYYLSRNYLNLYSLVLPGVTRSYAFAFLQPADTKLVALFNRYIDTCSKDQSYGYLMSEMSAAPKQMSFSDYVRLYPERVFLISLVSVLFVFAVLYFVLHTRQKQRLLEAESRAKTEFLSRMSHDMRTPMNAIIGLSGLAMDVVKEPEGVDYLDKINSSGKYLLGLINDTLDMSRIESGKISLYLEPYHVSELTRMLEELLEPKAADKNVRLIIRREFSDDPALMLDRLRFTQIFVNLATNAVKFTPSGGTVEVSAELPERKDRRQTVRVVVRDTGIGMSAEFQKRMYNSFEQERETGTVAETGSGLGLAIVKKLGDLMGASITCVSEPGEGTVFTVVLSAELAPAGADTGKSREDSAKQLAALTGKRALLVEDHPLNVKVATKLLEKQGMLVDNAENGKIAIEKFSLSSVHFYDVILMDIRMPVLDGLSSARQIRALPRPDAKTVPIVAMTANAYAEDVEKSREAGMNAHISKPIDPVLLYETIAGLLQKRNDA